MGIVKKLKSIFLIKSLTDSMDDQLYVLKLEMGKWYIGRTANVERRFQQHVEGVGAKWTGLHKPISIEMTRPLLSEHDEDMTTLEYMIKYGIYNVRGGKWCAVEFRPWQVREVERVVAHYKTSVFISEKMRNMGNFFSDMWSSLKTELYYLTMV